MARNRKLAPGAPPHDYFAHAADRRMCGGHDVDGPGCFGVTVLLGHFTKQRSPGMGTWSRLAGSQFLLDHRPGCDSLRESAFLVLGAHRHRPNRLCRSALAAAPACALL